MKEILGYAFMNEDGDEFSFPEGISNTQKYKQLGNSVAIPVIEEIALKMIESLDYLR